MPVRLRVNIKEGVRKGLCNSCRMAHIIIGASGRETVRCQQSMDSPIIPEPVVECSDYSAKNAMSMHDMEQKAWVIEVKSGKIMGFKPPTEE